MNDLKFPHASRPGRAWLRVAGALCALAFGFAAAGAATQALDADGSAWTALLKKHVVLVDEGKASRVDYAGFAADRAALDAYAAMLSAVPKATFDRLTPHRQMAFLINAYNVYTIELILTRYPKLASIKDLGNLLNSPWKQRFVPLFGGKVSLDAIEHEMLRAPGRYDDPRIHFAVNCASISCPMLRDEAFVGDRLDQQLDDQARRFMADRKRNRYDAKSHTLQVSKLFDWYGEDFSKGHRGIASTGAFFARYADVLADAADDREAIRTQRAPITFVDYDWNLNDAKR